MLFIYDGGFVLGGFCPWGFCPRWILSMGVLPYTLWNMVMGYNDFGPATCIMTKSKRYPKIVLYVHVSRCSDTGGVLDLSYSVWLGVHRSNRVNRVYWSG